MKRKLVAIAVAVFAMTFGAAAVVSAQGENKDEYKSSEIVKVEKSETIDGAFYGAGTSVTIAGTIKGDVYCAAQDVFITGRIEGDLICAAQTITIGGEVMGDARLVAQTVSYEGIVQGSATTLAQTIRVRQNAEIAHDFNGAGQSVTIDGKIGRDVLLGADTMSVSGSVDRNILGEYSTLTVESGAAVNGAVKYTSKNNANIASGSVKGEVAKSTPPANKDDSESAGEVVFGMAVYMFFSFLLVSLVIALIAPRVVHVISENGLRRLLASVLTGFFVLFGTPIVVGLLAATVIGIPLAAFVLLVWFVVLILSGPVFGYYLGRVIMQRRTTHPLLIMLVGSTVLLLSYVVPIANIFTFLAALTIGSGMIVLELSKRYQRPVYKVKVKG